MKALNIRQKIAAMFELEILKIIPRKRASTSAIEEGKESRKRACGTIETGLIHDKIAKVALKAYMYHQKAERGAHKNKMFFERKSRQRVRLLFYDQECCDCENKIRFRTNEVYDTCGHWRCVECLAR